MNYSPVQLAAHKENSDPDAVTVLDDLASVMARVADLPVSTNGAKQAQRELFELWQAADRLRVEALRRLTAVTESGLSAVLYASDTRYVAHQQGITNKDANMQLRLASFLASNTASGKAVMNGEIGLGHADALASAWRSHREEFEDIEQQFLDAIPGRDVDSFNRLVKQWEWRITKNGTDDVEKAFDRRSIYAQSTLDGSVTGSFSFPGDMGEVFLDGIFSTPDSTSGVVEPRTLRQRQADTLIENLTGEIVSEDNEGSTDTGASGSAPRTKIDAVIDIATLGGIIDGVGKQWSLEDLRSELHRSGQLPPTVIEILVCDASFRRIIFDGPDVVLAYNRATPLIPPALRRTIQIRDGGCVVDGCDRSHQWCDVHHLVERSNGGETTESNLGLVCRRHHTMLHLGQIVLSRDQQTGSFSTSLP